MKQMRIFLLLVVPLFALAALGQTEVGQPILAVLRFIGTTSAAAASTQALQPPPPTIASAVDREISAVEKQIVEAAEAMPEDKFNFSPESLNIPGSDYKGVRTVAVQVKHVAASNYALWSPLTGDKFPENFIGGNGPYLTLTMHLTVPYVT
jgi:hypothetical protein